MPFCCVLPWQRQREKRSSSPTPGGGDSVPLQVQPNLDTGSQNRFSDFGDIALNGLLAALRVTVQVGAVFPPLQGAAGGLLELVGIFQKAGANKEDIKSLTRRINRLNEAIPSGSDSFPESLRNRVERFRQQIEDTRVEIHRLESQSYGSQLLKAEQAEAKIAECIQSLSWSIDDLRVGSLISTELAVDSLKVTVTEGFQRMGQVVGLQLADFIGEIKSQPYPPSGPLPRNAIQARFDYCRKNRIPCDPDTRTEALTTVYRWLLPLDMRLVFRDPPLFELRLSAPVFWIHGVAGTGKSTLAQTIAEWCDEAKFLGASFFCARHGERNNVQLIFPTIANQLSCLSGEFQEAVIRAMKENPDIHVSLASQQLQKLIVEPLHATGDTFPACAIVIDALDECDDVEAVSVILKALSLYVSRLHPLKFIITSRPVANVYAGFRERALLDNTQQFPLSKIPPETTHRDITLYLRTRLSSIKDDYFIDGDWPTSIDIDRLVNLAGDLFIFAATAVKFIEDQDASNPRAQLSALLASETGLLAPKTSTSPFTSLDALYLQVLNAAFPNMDSANRSMKAQVKLIFGSIALLRDQLSPGALDKLLDLPSGSVRATLRRVHSIMTVPSTDEDTIQIIHKSFSDFLVDPSRCTDIHFLVKPPIQHTVITKACLRMLETLRRDICCVGDESLLNIEIPDLAGRLSRHTSPQLQYACRYWAHHLFATEMDQEILDLLHSFCERKMLYWLEALSLLGELDIAVEALQSARKALEALPLLPVKALAALYDCERAVRSFYPAINASCFQIYSCAVPFSPVDTTFHTTFIHEALRTVKIRSTVPQSWSLNTIVAEAHSATVDSVVFSPNGARIVSGSHDHSVRLWDARTGSELHALHGHSAGVHSVTFSPLDGKEIMSGSDDHTVKLWDASTGACLQTWSWHHGPVRCVTYSSNGRYAASSSDDKTVVLWEVAKSGPSAEISRFTEHVAAVTEVVFSRDGTLLFSASTDGTSSVWDVARTVRVKLLEYDYVIAQSVAVSHDDQLIACGLADSRVVIWRRDGWTRERILEGHASCIWSVAFSPDDSMLASGSWDRMVRLWNVTTGTSFATLQGNTDQVISLNFSPDGLSLVTGGADESVRVWELPQSNDRTSRRMQARHYRSVESGIPVEGDTSYFNPQTGMYSSKGPGPEHQIGAPVRTIAFSPDESLVATASWDGKIRLWDVSSGRRVKTLWMDSIQENLIMSLSWSPEGKHIVSGGHDMMVRIWDVERGMCTQTCDIHTAEICAALFVPDRQHVLSASQDGSIRSWKLAPGSAKKQDSDIIFQATGPIQSMALSDNAEVILSGTLDDALLRRDRRGYPTVRLHARASRDVLWTERRAGTESLALSRDCTRALSGSHYGKIFLYDLSSIMKSKFSPTSPAIPETTTAANLLLAVLDIAHGREIRHVSFSSDEQAVVSEASFTPLDPEFRPRSSLNVESSAPVHYLFDGWLWRAKPQLRRICWIPPTHRNVNMSSKLYSGDMATRGNIIVFGTNSGRTVIVDVSECD